MGQIGSVHVLSSKELSNIEYIAAYHPNSEKLNQFTKRFNIEKAYDDLDRMLSDNEIDAIDICTPTDTHFELISKCLKANKKVLVEKPITRTVEELDKLLKISSNLNDHLMVAQYCRFIPEYDMARKIVNRGEIGTPVSVRAHRRVNAPTYNEWFFDESKSGGIILDLMIHDIDSIIWILDDPIDSIYATGTNFFLKKYDTPDCVSVIIKFHKGTIATINGSWILPSGFFTKIELDTLLEIFGDKGVIEINDRSDSFMKLFTSKQGFKLYGTDALKIYKNELSYFSDCILENKSIGIDFQSIRTSLDACCKALESYRSKKPVFF